MKIYILDSGQWKEAPPMMYKAAINSEHERERRYSEQRRIADRFNEQSFNSKIYWVAESEDELPEAEEAVQEVQTS